ncbi:DMT family transporter [Apibacter raozihei]|uniref:DMT family transporter n=1 Tax=Apibacter raozihei TaxID=2500547 RepID=UPI000FE37268|nr:DMT family transporter [Apibacter raozihei]
MKEVLISVLFNVGVSIILKIFSSKSSASQSLFPVITYNYIFSALFCYFIYHPSLTTINDSQAPWLIYILMSILMPVMFILIGLSIKHIGIARTDIAQRISLLLTLVASFLFFKEDFTWKKIAGLSLGFISIFFIFHQSRKSKSEGIYSWLLPVLIFFGMGVISILYKVIAANQEISFTTSTFFIFVGSFITGVIILAFSKQKFNLSSLVWGLAVGVFNFGNVLFYLKAHQTLKHNPSMVFATMNLGVIILGSITGICFFKEKMSSRNYFGLLLALISIILITFWK